jgi:hypothetical protein
VQDAVSVPHGARHYIVAHVLYAPALVLRPHQHVYSVEALHLTASVVFHRLAVKHRWHIYGGSEVARLFKLKTAAWYHFLPAPYTSNTQIRTDTIPKIWKAMERFRHIQPRRVNCALLPNSGNGRDKRIDRNPPSFPVRDLEDREATLDRTDNAPNPRAR